MFELEDILLIQTFIIAYYGLSVGYHIALAFRDIESKIGEPGFYKYLKLAIKQAVHHYDIGILFIIIAISFITETNPVTYFNIGVFLFGIGFAAYWDDKHDAPPKELVAEFIAIVKKWILKK